MIGITVQIQMQSTTRLFLMALGWAVLAWPAPGFSAAPAAPNDKPRLLIAQLRRGQLNQLWLEATVENVKGAMMVDTGSPSTVLSQDKFGFLLRGPEHQLPPGVMASTRVNSLAAKVALARDFRLGGNDLGGTLVKLVGERYLSGGAFPYRDRRRDFDGMLGENFLRRYHGIVDCQRQLLYLILGPTQAVNLTANLPANGWTRVPMADTGSHFTVPCTLSGHHFRLIVDTGSPFTSVDDGLAHTAGLSSNDLPMRGGLVGNDPAHLEEARVKTLQIGDYTASDVCMTMNEHLQRDLGGARQADGLPIVGLLGGDTLGFNGAVIDVGEHALYLKHP